jgi:hypothetical protein
VRDRRGRGEGDERMVAIANKNARIAWALLAKNETLRAL